MWRTCVVCGTCVVGVVWRDMCSVEDMCSVWDMCSGCSVEGHV